MGKTRNVEFMLTIFGVTFQSYVNVKKIEYAELKLSFKIINVVSSFKR